MMNPGHLELALDINRLRVLSAVVGAGSLSGAGASLGVTASAVSQQLATLEREVGVALVERTRTGVVPTPAGELLVARAREIADLLADSRAAIQVDEGSLTGRLTVAAVASACVTFVSRAVSDLRAMQPGIQVAVQSGEPSDSISAVSSGRVEIAVVDEYDNVPIALPDDLESVALCADRLVALGPTGAFGATTSIRIAALRDRTWVMPPVMAACGQAVRAACRSAGFEPDVRWETDDMLALERAVADGHGIAVLPRLAVRENAVGIDVLPLQRPALRRSLIMVVRRSAAARPSVRAVLDAISRSAG